MTSAVLIIDVQRGVFESETEIFDAQRVIDNINILIDKARLQSSIVIFIQHEIQGVAEYGSKIWQLCSKLNVMPHDERVRKTTPDSFSGTNLDDILQKLDVDSLVVTGYASDVCIDRTTFSAVTRGYSVKLIKDAHTTQSKGALTASQIRDHHNVILSMYPQVELIDTVDW
ncbi:Streptothricin hydrolase [BD1-7 clade bacterium]|uniref:Streptothricin hydrolase n=1 Tax=BD1-7 clade bacterium TaxID=2029982 RepID=A0A5S9R0C2_9GAMM|nr:Streptothricin hydrolase [BD1-7 clade bacterium]